ncbi:MAG: hypothetical protein OET79_17055 [Nitrospirota bacterium]|nr:hypothetical protein [Nitrospirota bacterium]
MAPGIQSHPPQVRRFLRQAAQAARNTAAMTSVAGMQTLEHLLPHAAVNRLHRDHNCVATYKQIRGRRSSRLKFRAIK